jgi:hypothetical protein
MSGATERRQKIAVLIGSVLALLLIASPVPAFTCEDVRGLTREQQNYWSQRLQLSASQRHSIWVSCYEEYRADPLRLARR